MIIRPNQYFTERQTPVDFDGVAKLTTIKGNSIVWNQLVQNGDFASVSTWQLAGGATYTVSNNVAIVSVTDNQSSNAGRVQQNIYYDNTHKYYYRATVKNNSPSRALMYIGGNRGEWSPNNGFFETKSQIFQTTNTGNCASGVRMVDNYTGTYTYEIKNFIVVDLTQMGLDSLTAQEFESLFSLPYYQYNQGTLLAFNGTGIKTTGKNLWDNSLLARGLYTDANFNIDPGSVYAGLKWWGIAGKIYTVTWGKNVNTVRLIINGTYANSGHNNVNTETYTPTSNGWIGVSFRDTTSSSTQWDDTTPIQIEIGSTASPYEPYHEETIALPIADYFPSGMKSAGTVYDELTETKAVTRIGERAYQAGDESDPTVITDMTNTYYPLVTPTETVIQESLQYPFFADGLEILLPQNTATPSTAPILADINYISTADVNTPYRKFWLKNANGDEWSLTDKEFRCFLNTPSGLGFRKTVNVTRYGEKAVKTSEVYDFPTPQGELLFYDSANRTRYEKYNELMRFLNDQPITLFYQIPVSILSGIPDIYSLDCEVTEVQKSESSVEKVLTSGVVFDGLSFYKGDEIAIEGTTDTYTINNPSDFPVGFEIKVEGTLENPYFTLEQDGEVYGEAKFDDSTAFDSIYVNSNDGEQNVMLEQGGSVLPNPLSYQDLSISNGSIYVTFVKLAKGESTLTIGMDSGGITNVSIRLIPMYRSV